MATTLARTATATTLTMAMMSSAAKESSAGVRGALLADV
jgi:hypothetical protein